MTSTETSTSTAPVLTGARAGAFTVYRGLIVVFLVLLLVQVFLAGLGIFGADVAAVEDEATELDAHRAFGHIISQPVALIVLIAAAVARPGRRIVQLTIAWVVVGIVQVALGIAGADAAALGGLHALNALIYVGLTVDLVRRANPGLLRS
jgi:hypothetical protein